jgi:tRNA1(Val) A37 N6-methylase TrmN6
LARFNADTNGLTGRIVVLDVTSSPDAFAAAGLGPDSADTVLMNPPFHDASRHRASPDAARQVAHMASAETLQAWVHAARRVLKSGGTLTMIWRADGLAEVLSALDRGFGSLEVLPIHPGPNSPAIRVLVSAVKGGRAPMVLHPGLMLQDAAGHAGSEAQAVLCGEAVLPLAKVSGSR